MIQHGFVLDLENLLLRYKNVEIPILLGTSENAGVQRLTIRNNEWIPPNSEKVIWVRLDGGNEQPMIIEPAHEKDGLIVGRTLVKSVDGLVPLRILNLSEAPRIIKKGRKIASCEPAQSIVSCDVETEVEQSGPSEDFVTFLQVWTRDLVGKEKVCANKMLKNYCTVFSGEGKVNGRTSMVKHHIDTGESKPIRQRPRRLPLAKREEVDKLIEDMRLDGVIEPSESPWCSPVVLVKKKDGSLRFCVDYRKLNNATIKDSYPLPRIDDTLDTLSGSIWFSTLDLKSGYWQVEIDDESKAKTAFSVGSGLWQFKVMPFGLSNAPATFERLMEHVLSGLHWRTCLLYLDDIIIMGKDFAEHLKNLQDVFCRLNSAGLKLNPKKCEFFRHEVKYLGHKVSADGVHTDEDKVKAVANWERPRNIQELRSFLGFCTYYRRFVSGFATLASPLHELTGSGKVFNWLDEHENAFKSLKKALCVAPVLAFPVPGEQFILDTDASGVGIGGVLSQLINGEEKVIAYYSTKLTKPEKNYCVTRRELLAIVKCIKHFHKYLYGQRFRLRTDHAALKWLLSFKEPEAQLARWIEQLQSYDFCIEHRKGSLHGNADGLSRRPCEESCKHCLRVEEQEGLQYIRQCKVLPDEGWSKDELRKEQAGDPILMKIIEAVKHGKRPEWEEISGEPPIAKAYWAQWQSLVVEDGVLYRVWESPNGRSRKNLMVAPRSRQEQILKECHNGHSGGHLGVKKTLENIKTRFYWIGCRQSVMDWIKKCDRCLKAKGPNRKTRSAMKKYISGAPFERIAMDILGPLPVSNRGNKYLLVVMDYFSKWPEVYPISDMETQTIVDVFVKNWVTRFGTPMELHSDQGRSFVSRVFEGVCKTLGIYKTKTTPMHPQSDGMVERFNRTIEEYLKKVVSREQRDWEEHVPMFLMAYRAAKHEATQFSPAEVVFGSEIRLPVDIKFGLANPSELNHEHYVEQQRLHMDKVHNYVRGKLKVNSDRMKAKYDVRANAQRFQEGQLVLLYNPTRKKGFCQKLQSEWDGPYVVVNRINDVVYRIRKYECPRAKMKIVHAERLAQYTGRTQT